MRMIIAEVIKLLKLILAMPATNPFSERLFSSLQRIKTYLHSTITNNQLNHFLIFHIFKMLTDRIDLTKVADEFVEKREVRKSKLKWHYLSQSLFGRTYTFRFFASIT